MREDEAVMKTTPVLLVALAALLALPLAAQEETQPDYSKPSLMRFVAQLPPVEPERDRNMHFYIGGVEFRALGTKWNIRPMLPFSGTQLRTNNEMPDPFSLTGTSIATGPRAWRTNRAMNAELRRIEKTERAKIRVRTK
jgi:hypothetical protein